jgi:hypothetical protein
VHRGLRAVTAASVLALGLAACGGSAGTGDGELPAGPGGAPATAAATPSVTPVSADDQVLSAYRTFWDAVIAAHKATDPQLPALAAVAANPELAKVRKAIALNKQQQISLRGTVGHDSQMVQVAGATATVEDCYDISGWDPIDVRTGDAIDVTDSGGTGRYHARYTLKRSGGGWIVTTEAPLGGC